MSINQTAWPPRQGLDVQKTKFVWISDTTWCIGIFINKKKALLCQTVQLFCSMMDTFFLTEVMSTTFRLTLWGQEVPDTSWRSMWGLRYVQTFTVTRLVGKLVFGFKQVGTNTVLKTEHYLVHQSLNCSDFGASLYYCIFEQLFVQGMSWWLMWGGGWD